MSFNPAEAEEGFSRDIDIRIQSLIKQVSIQPKPKKGLVDVLSGGKYSDAFVSFNPAEAEEGFSRLVLHSLKCLIFGSFNPAEAEEGFSRSSKNNHTDLSSKVSIQPKPKKGLVVKSIWRRLIVVNSCFNPAEAEEGFSRERCKHLLNVFGSVSIQPKPKKGLVENAKRESFCPCHSFNPAEAEEGFSSKVRKT